MKHKIAWVTDIHLDHLCDHVIDEKGLHKILSKSQVESFCIKILETKPTFVVISGDISTSLYLKTHLQWLRELIPINIPIYFVLGNHDYYFGSILELRNSLNLYDGTDSQKPIWLNVVASGFVKLTPKTALIGHDGWYDGGYGNFIDSKINMPDWRLIKELVGSKHDTLKVIERLADEAAEFLTFKGHEACTSQGIENLIIVTHVPPFKDNSRAPDGSLSGKDWLPCMSSRRIGEAIAKLASSFPKIKMTCLSGHTHTFFSQNYRSNLLCLTGQSDHNYKNPALSIKILEIE